MVRKCNRNCFSQMYYEGFVFNMCLWLESVGKLMKGEDGLVKRVVWNLGGCNSGPSFTTGTLWHLGIVTTGTAPGLVAIPAEGNLMLETGRLIPQPGDCNADTNQHSRGTSKECLQMGTLLLSRRSRGNRIVDLLEHQLIVCSMENASWFSVVGSWNKVLISELMSPNFKELQKISTSSISLHWPGHRQVNRYSS